MRAMVCSTNIGSCKVRGARLRAAHSNSCTERTENIPVAHLYRLQQMRSSIGDSTHLRLDAGLSDGVRPSSLLPEVRSSPQISPHLLNTRPDPCRPPEHGLPPASC